MSIENPKKPNLKIVREDDPVQKQKKDIMLEHEADLTFFEKIENIDQISDESRKNILDKLKQLLEQVETLDDSDDKVKWHKITILSRIYNQIYRFEADEEVKKELKQKINQLDFAFRQRLLS